MRGKRYHVQQGERVLGREPEWDVLDRLQTHANCPGCPGTTVHSSTSRRAAREECARLNAEAETNSTCVAGGEALRSGTR